MKLLRAMAPILCLALLGSLSVKTAKADEYNKKTIFTFSAPIEVPGYRGPMVLPAGTYMFKLLDSAGDRNIVQIFNKEGTHLYSTVLAIPDYRAKRTGTTIVKFEERSANNPEALKAWFYPGDVYGQEFVYPKARAMELAKDSNEPVLSMPDEAASNMAEPSNSAKQASVTALEKTPVKAEKPNGQEVEMSQVVTTTPSANNNNNLEAKNNAKKELPKTASDIPLLALMGLLLCGAGVGLRMASKRTA
jgi:hypothetical protein